MKSKVIYFFLIIAAAGVFDSCKKTSSQVLRDLEADHLQKYVKKYLPSVDPTPTGLYYLELKPGDASKDSIKTGDIVKVFYSGFLIEENDSLGIIDGEQFDGTGDYKDSTFNNHYEPFTFTVGSGSVLPGWDEAIRYMKDGGEAKWVLPSRIGYAAQPQQGIPAYSPLVFYVKVYKVYRTTDEYPVVKKLPL